MLTAFIRCYFLDYSVLLSLFDWTGIAQMKSLAPQMFKLFDLKAHFPAFSLNTCSPALNAANKWYYE